MSLTTVPLGEVFEVQLGKMLDAKGNKGEPFPYLANRNVQWDVCDTTALPQMPFTEADRVRFSLRPGDLLVCEGGEVGRTAIWRGEITDCYFQKAIHRLRPRRSIEPRFALYYMRWATTTGAFRHLTTSTSIAHLTKEKLETAPFPYVHLSEQRRIAAILDEADALLRKRREALGLLDDLLRSAFLEMFGDPVTNPRGWPVVALADVTDGFRNGLSPSTNGEVEGRVLTLGAVTGVYFDASKCKSAVFDRVPDDSQLATDGTFLICRGNGNLDLVGQGKVAWGAPANTVFPDTIIACRPQTSVLHGGYLSEVWRSGVVRDQIVAGARTTNGTFKVNQQVLAVVKFPLPPIAAQHEFATVAGGISEQRRLADEAVARSAGLFDSLLASAFAGGL